MFLKKVFLLVTILAAFLSPLCAQSNPLESEIVEQTISGIEAVAKNAIAASFIPMTDFNKGDLIFIGSPGYLRIREVYQNPSIRGDPLNGGTLGIGLGYALSDRFMQYNILTGIYLKGALEGNFFNDGPVSADVEGSFLSLFSGIGFELIQSDLLSLPLFLGLNGGFYKTDILYPEYENGGYTFSAQTSGSGFLGGISGGVAAKIKYRGFSITPYYLYMFNFNGAELDSTIEAEGMLPLGPYGVSHSIDSYSGGYLGLSMAVKTRSGWFYNLSIRNLFPSWSKKDDAIDFTALILSVGFIK